MKLLVPFKGLQEAKSRWPQDGPSKRELVWKMLVDNIATAQTALGADNVFLVSPERLDQPPARLLATNGGGLNEDLQQARESILQELGSETLAVLLPDLPLLTQDDVLALASAARRAQVVVCPDHLGTGTNALALSPGDCLPFLFEGESCQRHRERAAALGLTVTLLERPGLANDCDDLHTLRKFSVIS